jgi:site-specific DNA recombinase
MKKLRFAPLIRVSTEKQEKQGESLETQKKQIQQYVKNLDGYIPDCCWKYSGQEHATEGYERKNLDQLLKDSGNDIFDAVIVCDASRWSRDNENSKAGLKILKKNGIRFFVGTSEFDLFLPQATLFLGMSTEMNEFFALEQTRKSMLNRIERAKKGMPTGGKLPYGRIWDKQRKEWSVDEEKVKNIRWAADQYLKGESMHKIADTLNMNMQNLWKVLNKRSGDTWELSFYSEKLNIDESVEIKIPRLFPQETFDRIRERAESNKTYNHGHIKNKYLLSRTVFCGHCGYAMFGQTNHSTRRYYRHQRFRKRECDVGCWVRADDLEDAVMVHLFSMYGDIENMEKAMLRAIPNSSKVAELRKQKQILEGQLEKAEKERQRLIKSIAKGIISDAEATKVIQGIRDREMLLTEEIEKIRPQIEKVPTEKQIKMKAELIKRTLEGIYARPGRMSKMSFEDKRKIVQTACGGKDAKGNRYGVYVKKPDKIGEPITYEIRGVLADIQGQLPMSLKDIQNILGLEEEYVGHYNPLNGKSKVKQDMFSKRHAHHSLCFYQ